MMTMKRDTHLDHDDNDGKDDNHLMKRPSRYAAFGEISKRTTSRHRPSMYAAFGEISKLTTSRHRQLAERAG